jgi:hypothetical protein
MLKKMKQIEVAHKTPFEEETSIPFFLVAQYNSISLATWPKNDHPPTATHNQYPLKK